MSKKQLRMTHLTFNGYTFKFTQYILCIFQNEQSLPIHFYYSNIYFSFKINPEHFLDYGQ